MVKRIDPETGFMLIGVMVVAFASLNAYNVLEEVLAPRPVCLRADRMNNELLNYGYSLKNVSGVEAVWHRNPSAPYDMNEVEVTGLGDKSCAITYHNER